MKIEWKLSCPAETTEVFPTVRVLFSFDWSIYDVFVECSCLESYTYVYFIVPTVYARNWNPFPLIVEE